MNKKVILIIGLISIFAIVNTIGINNIIGEIKRSDQRRDLKFQFFILGMRPTDYTLYVRSNTTWKITWRTENEEGTLTDNDNENIGIYKESLTIKADIKITNSGNLKIEIVAWETGCGLPYKIILDSAETNIINETLSLAAVTPFRRFWLYAFII